MKNLGLILTFGIIMIMISFSGFTQISSEDLIKERNNKIEEMKKGPGNPHPDDIMAIYNRYDETIKTAIEAETKAEIAEKERKANRTPSFGAKVEYEGDQGRFRGGSLSNKRSSEAYATVAQADANAHLTRVLADRGGSTTISAPNMDRGLEGVIINRSRYRELIVTIRGIDSANENFKKSFRLGKEQQVKTYLLPGKYEATVKSSRQNPGTTTFSVKTHQTHNNHGNDVFFFIAGGTEW
jgi:hypothetical protein